MPDHTTVDANSNIAHGSQGILRYGPPGARPDRKRRRSSAALVVVVVAVRVEAVRPVPVPQVLLRVVGDVGARGTLWHWNGTYSFDSHGHHNDD